MSENVNVSSVYDKDYLDKLLNTVESKFIMLSIEENKTDLESKKKYDPHKKSTDEKEFLSRIHYHDINNTPSGIKIRESFAKDLPTETLFKTMKISGGTRSIHHDLQLVVPKENESDIIKNVELKYSCQFKPIDTAKQPWSTCVQFYNGPGNKFSIGTLYAKKFYDSCIDEIIAHFDIQSPKPSFEEWSKDAFKQSKPSTEFVKEIREKGYKSKYLSDCRKNFNKTFVASSSDLVCLFVEAQKVIDYVFNCKDYWLQIHGDINDPDMFHVKWTNKINPPEIISVKQEFSKNHSDINFKLTCSDNQILYAKMRWGYGQCITNIRIDIK